MPLPSLVNAAHSTETSRATVIWSMNRPMCINETGKMRNNDMNRRAFLFSFKQGPKLLMTDRGDRIIGCGASIVTDWGG